MVSPMEKYVRYICNNCRYTFRRKESWSHPLCPNCGEEKSYEREDTINKMITDSL